MTNHVTFESALKNYYITSCSINMKAKGKTLNQKHKFVKKIYEKMAATNKTLVFSAAVHGFHVYGDVWNPHENEELVGLFEKKQFV